MVTLSEVAWSAQSETAGLLNRLIGVRGRFSING